MDDEKLLNIKRALAEYFGIDDPDAIFTIVLGIDFHNSEGGTSFSSLYHGLTAAWAIGNLDEVKQHIKNERNRAALQQSLEEMAAPSDGSEDGQV